MLDMLDLLFRTAAFSLLLLLCIVLLKDHRERPSGVLGAVFSLGLGSDLMWPLVVAQNWEVLFYPLHLLSLAALLSFCLLTQALFTDSFRWRWWYLLVYVVLLVSSFVGHYITFGDWRGLAHWVSRSEVAYHGLALVPLMAMLVALVVAALVTVLKDWRIDLVESRRRARAGFVLALGGLIIVVLLMEYVALGTPRSGLVDTVSALLIFFMVLGFNVWFLSCRPAQAMEPRSSVFPSEDVQVIDSSTGDGPAAAMIHEIRHLMTEKQVFREEGLTIARLAEKLDTQEYRLRRLINGHLGYRNYNQFLNRYRIEEAARQLTAPETKHLPVLSIALDVGYRSLAPFNKAFKEIHGMTPTTYRSRNRS